MTTTVNMVNNFSEAFPNKIIKHTGRLDYEILNNIKTALKRNFVLIPNRDSPYSYPTVRHAELQPFTLSH